jgi:hypothetical protein
LSNGEEGKELALDILILKVSALIHAMQQVHGVLFQNKMKRGHDMSQCGFNQKLGTYKAGPMTIRVEERCKRRLIGIT